MKIKNKVSGFTLIEIMIAVAIIGILSSIAIPSYINYVKKSQASEIVTLFDMARVHMMDYYTKNGEFPPNYSDWSQRNADIGLESKTSYRTDLINQLWVGHGGVTGKDDTSSGHIAITLYDNGLGSSNTDAARFIAVGEKVGGRFIWYCNVKSSIGKWSSKVDDKYFPKRCQNQ